MQGGFLPSKRVEILVTVAGLLGAIIFFAMYDQAFPSAALRLELSRDEILQLAQEAMYANGYSLEDYEVAVSFSQSWFSSVYLQHILGIPETNRLIREGKLPIYYWHIRWFRPLQKQEFSLDLAPHGEVVGFSHSIEEDAPGASLSQGEARALAEKYIVENQHWNLDDWEPVTDSSQDQPGGRTDHYFEWKRRDFEVGESELKTSISVQGNQVGSYNYWLKVPEAFSREFSEQRHRASFIDSLSTMIGVYGFSIVAIAFFGVSLLRGVRPRRVAYLVALLVGLVSLLDSLNYLSLSKMYYGTTQNYTQFWFEEVFNALISFIPVAAFTFLIWVGGVRLSKLAWQRQDKVLPTHGDRWEALARSGWRGLMLAGLMGAYVVIFYLVAVRLFGGWVPMDVEYTNLYATPFPFLGPIADGLLPAIEEEVLFRLVGIGLILGLMRRRWLALLIPGALWAFAHLTYVRDPYYMRGIELTVSAIFLLGLFFLYFDLTTVIVAHMTYNAMLGALPMLRSGEPYFVFSGLVVVLVLVSPVLPGLLGRLRRGIWGGRVAIPEPEIGLGTSEDLPGLVALPVNGYAWGDLLADPQAVVFCLRVERRVIGVAVGELDGESGRLARVYVTPVWRERYWGSALVDAVCAYLEQNGASSIETAVAFGDHRAVAFLAGQGWRPQRQIFARGPQPSFSTLWLEFRKGLSAWRRRVFRWRVSSGE